MTRRLPRRLRAGVTTTLALLACAVLIAPSATAAVGDIWPDKGGYLEKNQLSTAQVMSVEGSDPVTMVDGKTYQPGDFLGYRAWTLWPSTATTLGGPTCHDASTEDGAHTVWAFVDSGGAQLAPAQRVGGYGNGGFYTERAVIILTGAPVTAPVSGILRASCIHTDGTATTVAASLRLTIAPSLNSLYNTPTQLTWDVDATCARTTVNAMGFTPGEKVTVSLVEEPPHADDAGATAVLSRTTTTADGAGGISTVEAPVSRTADYFLTLVAVGSTSRYALVSGAWDFEPSWARARVDAWLVADKGSPTGQGVRVALPGGEYDPGATVVVAIHSADAPIELGTLTVEADGSGSGTFALPQQAPAGAKLWVGEKTGGYTLASTPLAQLSFTDVPANYPFASEIGWMAYQGITTGFDTGCGTRAFQPQGSVNRDAMAAFLFRNAGSPAWTAPSTSPFVDVPTTSPFYKEITWLADKGVTKGWQTSAGLEFRPSQAISRDAMAAFLYRYAGSPAFTDPTTSAFRDVPTSNTFYKEISWLADNGISTGWKTSAGAEFRPFDNIGRDAMAAFLKRYSGLSLPTAP